MDFGSAPDLCYWGQCCMEQGGCLEDEAPHSCKAYPAACALRDVWAGVNCPGDYC